MANTALFSSAKTNTPPADTVNEAGGRAYQLTPKHALAQLATTGCFNGTFYTSAKTQLDELIRLTADVDDNLFLAKLAIYSRERAFMKDMPVALLAILSALDTGLFHRVFDRVVDNGRTLRTLFQMIRSGQFGPTGLSSSRQRAFQRWLNSASVNQLLAASIGHDPSLRDVLRLARPTPTDNARRALFGWLVGKESNKWGLATESDLPEQVQLLNHYRKADSAEEQIRILEFLHVRWDLLADSAKGPAVWAAIALQMGPQALRMNLNTLIRHEVIGKDRNPELVDYIAGQIADPEKIRQSRQFPYQFLAAYLNASDELPQVIRGALCSAAEIACGNVPKLPGPVVIGLDVSGSMGCPATGYRGGPQSSKVRCIDVAALFAAALLRRNPDSVVIPFDDHAHEIRIDPQDTILSLAERLAKFGGGGTDCSIPLTVANERHFDRRFAGCVMVSDDRSWFSQGRSYGCWLRGSTDTMAEWQKFVKIQGQKSKLICVDIQPNTTTQAPDRPDILNVGGFSDAVFSVVAGFLSGSDRFVSEIEAVEL